MTDMLLQTLASHLDDIEGLRKATANRLRILTTTEPDEDGVMRGFGLTENNFVVKSVMESFEVLETEENETIKILQKQMKAHPLGPWVKKQKGVGEKQAARLLASIGDPYWIDEAEFEDDNGNITKRASGPRTVSQLWAYAGLHVDSTSGEAIRHRKGVQSNWKTEIKTRAYLVSTSCIKQMEGGYRKIYDARRAATKISHPDWTDGHSHNDALRIISKAILKDMWIEAKRLHDEKAVVGV